MTAKRLLYLATDYDSFASHKMEIARAAARDGFEVFIAASGTKAAPDGIRVLELAWRRAPSTIAAILRAPTEFFQVWALLRRVQPDLLHNIDLKPSIVGSMASFGHKTRVINSINGLGFVFFDTTLVAQLVRGVCGFVLRMTASAKGARAVVQNQDDAAFMRNRLGIGHARISIIRGSGVDPDAFVVQKALPPGRFRFLIISRLLYMKGIQVAVAALGILRQRGVDAELVVAGAPDPGNPSSIGDDDIRKWAAQPGVTFTGQVKDVRGLLGQAHVVLQPSLSGEGLPRALLEAAASGKAMIGSDIPGIREIIVDRDTGLLVPPDDPAALADAMQDAVSHPDRCLAWGVRARAKLEAEFTGTLIQSQHLALYRDIGALAS